MWEIGDKMEWNGDKIGYDTIQLTINIWYFCGPGNSVSNNKKSMGKWGWTDGFGPNLRQPIWQNMSCPECAFPWSTSFPLSLVFPSLPTYVHLQHPKKLHMTPTLQARWSNFQTMGMGWHFSIVGTVYLEGYYSRLLLRFHLFYWQFIDCRSSPTNTIAKQPPYGEPLTPPESAAKMFVPSGHEVANLARSQSAVVGTYIYINLQL